MVRVGGVVELGNVVAVGVVRVADDRRGDVKRRPDVLVAALERAAGVRVDLNDLLARIVIVLDRRADDPLRPPARAIILIRDRGRADVAETKRFQAS